MKSSLRYLFALLSIFFIITQTRAQQLKTVNLQLKWKHQYQFAGYYAAIEKGFYKEAGFQVNLIEAVEGQNPSDAVFSGKAEFGVCTSDILLMRSQNKKAVVLATIFQHSPQILIASKQSGIEHVHDLVGKRIAMEPNAADIIAFMNDEGVPLDKCIIDQHPFDVNMLINGEIDAISAYSTDEPFILHQANFLYTEISPSMGGIDFYGDVLFTTEALIKNNPDLVNNFREASLKGWKYAMDHPEEIVELIYNKYSKRHSIEHLQFEAAHLKNMIMADVVEPGYANPGKWESIAQTYKKLKMVDASFTTKGLLYSDYLKPKLNIPWELISVFILIVMIIGSVTFYFYNTSRKLKKEISNRKYAEDEKRKVNTRLRTLLVAIEQSPVTTVITDLKGNIEYVNPKFSELTGYTAEEAMGQNPRILKAENKSGLEYKELWNTILTGQSWQGVFKNKKKNGEFYWESAIISPVKDENGTITHFLAVKEDITERKRAEEEIRLKNEQLIIANADKDRFMSILAHDLKSPFNAILGYLGLLTENIRNYDIDKIENQINIVNNSAQKVFHLLEDLLLWARSQSNKIPYEPKTLNFTEICESIVGNLSLNAKNKNITIHLFAEKELSIFADKDMLKTILRNLISNAIKFTNIGGRIDIGAEQTLNNITISVADNGIGIAPEIAIRLFDITQTHTTQGTANESGTGLGLLLCKEFVEKHGGKIWVESEEGKGARFYFTLSYNQ